MELMGLFGKYTYLLAQEIVVPDIGACICKLQARSTLFPLSKQARLLAAS